MKKILLALFAMALVVAFTAPAYAAMKGASFKFSGFYRLRGISMNNVDRDEDAEDGRQYYDNLIRPRFTVKTDGGKVVAMYEMDTVVTLTPGGTVALTDAGADATAMFTGKPIAGGPTAGDDPRGVRTNRWLIDFAIPGSALRMRMARTDYTSPDKEIFDSGGNTRLPGIALYGKLSKNMSLSMFTVKYKDGNDKSGVNVDKDLYFAGLGMKVSPALTLTPWLGNSRDSGDNGHNYWYGGLNAKTKMGIFSVNASGVVVGGDLNDDTDVSAWALLLRTSASFGKLKLKGNLTMLSGDDGSDAADSGKFVTPRYSTKINNGDSGWFQGGQIATAKDTSYGPRLAGVRYEKLNGAVVIEGRMEYKVSKAFTLLGSVHFYQSAEAKQSTATVTYDDATNFGTEVNGGFRWQIYPSVQLRAVAAYLAAGDYGKVEGAKDLDDTWMLGWSLRHGF